MLAQRRAAYAYAQRNVCVADPFLFRVSMRILQCIRMQALIVDAGMEQLDQLR